MYNLSPIDSPSYIGNSLPLINLNYEHLDQWTVAVQASARDMWQPLVDLYTFHEAEWNNGLTIAQNNSAKWISYSTTVENLSASWLSPLTLFYPYIFSDSTNSSTVKDIILSWLNQNFPVSSAFRNFPFYIENQKAIVYNYSHHVATPINEYLILTDSTSCGTNNSVVHVTCRTELHGVAFCSNGDQGCDGYAMECGHVENLKCYYPTGGPYVIGQGWQTVFTYKDPIRIVDGDGNVTIIDQDPDVVNYWGANDTSALSYIKAHLTLKFSDTYESRIINTLKFKVQDCKWVYDPTLTF
jgi:hypothetical protein